MNTLRLDAYNDIALNAAITGTAGGLTLTAGANVANTGAVSATGAVNVGVFNLINGRWSQIATTLPAFAARDFRFLTTKASFLRATGGTGVTGSAYAIGDVYGLQGMASSIYLGTSFALTGDIAAAGTANWNSGAGFVPIGDTAAFSGSFDGANHVINGLTINRPADNSAMFTILVGTITNVGLVGGSVKGGRFAGSLVGLLNGGSLGNVYATTPVTGSGTTVGGLVGNMIAGSITNAYATGAVTGQDERVGGLIGQLDGGTISDAYATGAATGLALTGGLIGYMSNGTVTRVYATGAVRSTETSASIVGGLIGEKDAGSVDAAYASGRVTGAGIYTGGLMGYNLGPVSNSYWDSYSTGQTQAFGESDGAVGIAVTSDPAQAAAANYAYKASAYAALPAATGLATAGATGFVFMPGDTTRPFLAFEVPLAGNPGVATNAANQIVLTNSHQLQLVGYNGATLAGSYALGNAIDLAETGRVTVGTPGSYSGMWAGTGFVAVGTAGSGIDGNAVVWNGSAFVAGGGSGFTGSLNGGGFTVQNLTIRRPMASYAALIGLANNGGTITNIGLTNATIAGASFSGALIGRTYNSVVSNAYSTGTVTATNGSGGLIGFLQGGSIAGSYSTANVSGTASIGGLVGSDYGATSNSYATGTVTGTGQYVGGLVGDSNGGGVFANVYATGNVTSTAGYVGGLVGWLNGGSLTGGRAAGTVTVNAPASVNYVGGLVGNAVGTIASSTAAGSVSGNNASYVGGLVGSNGAPVSGSSASGSVSSSGGYVGGLLGYTTGAVTGSSASGTVVGQNYVGGLIGQSIINGTPVSASSASGNVTASGIYVGGLIGYTAGQVSTSFASGSVAGTSYVGGLIGYTAGSFAGVNQAYATGAVTATAGGASTSYAGGLIGFNASTIPVLRSYATGSVSANSTGALLGGLIGSGRATITQSYATGTVGTIALYRGGLIGSLVSGGVAASDFWDSYSTGTSFAIGSTGTNGIGTNGAAIAVISDPLQSGAANYAYKTSAYTGTGGLTAADWVFFDGQTRPFGAWEAVAPGGALTNSHQLQLIGRSNAAAQAGSYTLGRNIDLAETGRVVAGTPDSYAGMWAGTGFVSLGSDGTGKLWNGTGFVAVGYADVGKPGTATGFGGNLAGGGFTVSNLSVNRADVQNVGLFGGASGAISNLTVTGTVTGYVSVGGLVGLQQGGSITGVTSSVNVTGSTGSAYVGGLVGFGSGTTIGTSSASGTVSATGAAGGLVGLLYNSVLTGSSASATVTGRVGRTGGLVGIVERSSVTGGVSSGTVNGIVGGTGYGMLRDGGTYNGDDGTGGF